MNALETLRHLIVRSGSEHPLTIEYLKASQWELANARPALKLLVEIVEAARIINNTIRHQEKFATGAPESTTTTSGGEVCLRKIDLDRLDALLAKLEEQDADD